jgi:A/G-specific adenine glycosylase
VAALIGGTASTIAEVDLIAFRATILNYYRLHGRDFLWRQDTAPYIVYVSEVMLQQTQTSRVAQLLPVFLARFPNFASLAAAAAGDVLAAWQGLGYNRRAMNLWRAAGMIMSDYAGLLPMDREALIALPGIGPNTAAAILCYAFNRAEAFVETNIRTVYIHHFAALQNQPRDRDILAYVTATMDCADPRRWFWALMDYGVYLKRTVGNLSKQALGQRPQSAFEGSLRQVRGAIVRALSRAGQGGRAGAEGAEAELPVLGAGRPGKGTLSAEALAASCATYQRPLYEQALADLVAEGLVVAEVPGAVVAANPQPRPEYPSAPVSAPTAQPTDPTLSQSDCTYRLP